MPRSDVYAGRDKGSDPHDYRYHSGFWAILPLEPVDATARVDIELVATLSTGDVVHEAAGEHRAGERRGCRW